MIGRNGVTLAEKWTPHPRSYLSFCVDDFPNWFFSQGPNSGVGSGSLLAVIEYHVEYAVKVARKMQREGLKTIEVKKEAVEDYDEYIDVSAILLNLQHFNLMLASCSIISRPLCTARNAGRGIRWARRKVELSASGLVRFGDISRP